MAVVKEQGIIAASKGVDVLGRIEGDNFLALVLQSDSASTRVADFKDKEMFRVWPVFSQA